MIARLIRWSLANRFLVLLATVLVAAWGCGGVAHAARCAPRSVGRPGHHPHAVPGQAPQHRREPGHLSVDDHDAVGARSKDRARLFVLRRIVRVRAVRGRHRPVLGTLARARIPEPGAEPAAGRRKAGARPGCHGRRLDLRVRAGRSQRSARPLAAARAAGLVPQVRAEDGAERRRGRNIGGIVRQYQVVLDPDRLRAYGITQPRSSRPSAARTRKPAARCSSWAKRSTWSAHRLPAQPGGLPPHPAATMPACRCASATSPSSSGRRCAAASPNSMAKAKWPAASS